MEPEARKSLQARESSHENCSCAGCVKAEHLTRKSQGDVAVLDEPVGRPRRRESSRESSQTSLAAEGKAPSGANDNRYTTTVASEARVAARMADLSSTTSKEPIQASAQVRVARSGGEYGPAQVTGHYERAPEVRSVSFDSRSNLSTGVTGTTTRIVEARLGASDAPRTTTNVRVNEVSPERNSPTSSRAAGVEAQRAYVAEVRSSPQQMTQSNDTVAVVRASSPVSQERTPGGRSGDTAPATGTARSERALIGTEQNSSATNSAVKVDPQWVQTVQGVVRSQPMVQTQEVAYSVRSPSSVVQAPVRDARPMQPETPMSTKLVERVTAVPERSVSAPAVAVRAEPQRSALTSTLAVRAEPQRVHAAEVPSSSQPLARSTEVLSSPRAPSPASPERSSSVRSVGRDAPSQTGGGERASMMTERKTATQVTTASAHRGGDTAMAGAPERNRVRHAVSQHAAALERRRVEVLGRIQRVLERTTPSNQRGMSLSQLMRLEVATKILELLDEEEYQGISELRSRPRLNALRRRRLSRIRGERLGEQELRKSRKREKRRKNGGGDGTQPSSEASLAPSGAGVAVKMAAAQKGAIAKGSTPSKSLDVFQAKINDDGDEGLRTLR
jgi:hypothetical protein